MSRRPLARIALILVGTAIIAVTCVACGPLPPHPPLTVSLPPQVPSDWFKGANLADRDPAIYGTPATDKAFQDLAGLGGNATFVNEYWYATATSSSTFAADPTRTASDASIVHAMAAAKSAGLRVGLKPGVLYDDGTWSAVITPADPAQWLATYQTFVDHYADLAKQAGADFLVLGTELDSMASGTTYETQWRAMIADLRSRFSGQLMYAASQNGYATVPFYDALDFITLEGYMPLTVAGAPTPTVADLVAAWSNFADAGGHHRDYVSEISAVQAKFNKPVVFTEMGYSSSVGSAASPAKWFPLPSQAEQANAYEAFFEVWSAKPWFKGAFTWGFTANDYSPIYDNKEDVRGKQAEMTVGGWWGGSTLAAPNLVHPAAPNGTLDAGFSTLGAWGAVNGPDAHFEFWSSRSGVTFECRDTFTVSGWYPCASPIEFHGMTAGQKSLQVRARDASTGAYSSIANRTWTVS